MASLGIQDTTRILQALGSTYPERVEIDVLMGRIGLDGARAVRAVRGLCEGGLVTTNGLPCAAGLPGSQLLLTEPGMAVAFGLVRAEDDPRCAIETFEAETLRQLNRHRESR